MAVAKRAFDITEELSYAVEAGDVEAVALLLPRARNLNAQNRHGTTVLMKAAGCGHAQIVRLLLEHGADPNLMRNDKFTALALAAFFGHTETVKTLMEFGARTEDVTRSGASAHTWATARTYAEVARCLDTPRPQTQATIQPRRRSARSRIFTLGIIATFVVLVCCGVGALVLSNSKAQDLPSLPLPKVEPPKVQSTATIPQPEPPTPKPVVNEAHAEPRTANLVRPTIKKSPTSRREAAAVSVVSEKPVEEAKISAPPVVVKPKSESPKPAALSPQILAPTKKAKVIQWP